MAKTADWARYRLTVEVNNVPAIHFYKKLGVQISGTYHPEVEMLLNLDGERYDPSKPHPLR